MRLVDTPRCKFYVCNCDRKQKFSESGYDVILVDEAQDMTPAQAAVLFNQSDKGAVVYLVGDARQRMYRWRGARDSFERVAVCREFTLSESFRFGPAVAAVANALLRLGGDADAPTVPPRRTTERGEIWGGNA